MTMLSMMREQGADAGAAGESAQAGLGAAPCRMRLGVVTGVEPLTVAVAGIPQPAAALGINERLTRGAGWRAAVSGDISGEVRVEQLETDISAGDRVLLLTEDDQKFYLVMKVVEAV